MPKGTRTFRASSATARARPYSPSPASDDDIDDQPHHSRPHRPRHDPTATKRVTVRKTPEQVRALSIAYQQLGARPSQADRRRLALEICLSERIVNTWFRDERSKRKKEGIASSRAQPAAVPATHPRLSAKTHGPSDDGDETDIDEDDELIDDDDEPLHPPPRKPDNNRHSEVSVANPSYALPGPSTPYHRPLYDYSAAHVGAYPETDLASTRSLSQVSPPLAVRQLNGTRIRKMVREQFRTHRVLDRPSGATHANHLSPAYAPSEVSSISEHDGERMFDAPSHSHSPMTNVELSPVRSEISLPATPLQNETPLPISLPPVGSLTHPPEGGWTSSWRWSFYGHTSSMRATLEPAKWTPESSDSESVLGLDNVNRISIRVSDYDKYDKPFDAGVKQSPFARPQ